MVNIAETTTDLFDGTESGAILTGGQDNKKEIKRGC
jgi:hypothetical protein